MRSAEYKHMDEGSPADSPLPSEERAISGEVESDNALPGGEGWGELDTERDAVLSTLTVDGTPEGEAEGTVDVGTHGVRVARNVATTIVTQLFTWAVSFIVVLYLPAYLGPAGMGKLSFAMAFATVIAAIIPLGTSTVLVKEVARDRSRVMSMMSTALALRIPLGVLGSLAAYAIATAMHLDRQQSALVLICVIGALIGLVNDAVVATLQGLEMLPRQNAVALLEKLLWSGGSIGLVLTRGKLWQIAAVGWVSSGIATIFNLTAFSKDIRQLVRSGDTRVAWLPEISRIKSMIAMGLPFLGWSVCVTLYGQTDPVVIRFVTGRDIDVGWYSVATKLVGTTLFLPSALMTALLPTLSRLHRENEAEFRALARRALSFVILCGVPLALVLGTMPDRVMSILPYGHKFGQAVPVLRIGGPGLLLWYLGIMLGTIVIATDGQKKMFGAAVTAAIAGVPLCALCSHLAYVKFGNAAVGAITSDCLIEFYLVTRYIQMLPRAAFDFSTVGFFGKCIAAAVPMSVFLWWASHVRVGIWTVFPCIVIYAAMCWLLGCVGPQDLVLARRLIAKKA